MRGMRRRLYISRNPDGRQFEQVEYIHANKQQTIQTDWIPGIAPKIELDWRIDNLVIDASNSTIFSCFERERNINFDANFGADNWQYNEIFLWNDLIYGTGGVIHTAPNVYYTAEHNLLTMDSKSGVYRKQGSDGKPVWKTVELETRTAANTIPLILLGNSNRPINKYDVWLYGVKCWNNGVLEREYVPAREKESGVYGLYDKIGGKFLVSDTGVDFLGPK